MHCLGFLRIKWHTLEAQVMALATQVLNWGPSTTACTRLVSTTKKPPLNGAIDPVFQSSHVTNWIDHFNGIVSSIQTVSQLNLTISLTDLPTSPAPSPWNRPNIWTQGIHRLFSCHVHMALMTELDPCHRWVHRLYNNHFLIRGPSLPPSFKQNNISSVSIGPAVKELLAWASQVLKCLRTNFAKIYFRGYTPTYSMNYSSYKHLHVYLSLAMWWHLLENSQGSQVEICQPVFPINVFAQVLIFYSQTVVT